MVSTIESRSATRPRPKTGFAMAAVWFAFSLLSFSGSAIVRASDPTDAEITNSIRRLFSDRCYTCHGPDDKVRSTEMRLDRDGVTSFKTGSGKQFAVPGD